MRFFVDKERFAVPAGMKMTQFFGIYKHRLEVLSPLIRPRLPSPFCGSFSEVTVGVKVSVIGIVNLSRFAQLQQPHTDALQLIDGTGQFSLRGNITVGRYPSGVVIGVRGTLDDTCCFTVTRVFEPMLPETEIVTLERPLSIAFVSDLKLDSEDFDVSTGQRLAAAINDDQYIHCLVVLGSTFGEAKAFTTKEWRANIDVVEVSPPQMLETFMNEINCMKLLIPGEFDPVDASLPQYPFPSVLIGDIENLRTTSNPASFTVEDVSFICCSGQSVHGVVNETNMGFHEAQSAMLSWRLLSPTCPATLPINPALREDIMVMQTIPNVFVCGSAPKFTWNEVSGTTVISVPDFSTTKTAVILDMGTFECRSLSFS